MNKNPSKLYIGITGSERYERKTEIKDVIFQIKKSFGNKCVIVSKGSLNGADKYIRKSCLEFELEYEEFSPSHLTKTLYSVLPDSYYGKPFSGRDAYQRNRFLLNRVDRLIIFRFEDDQVMIDLEKIANKKNKKIKLFIYYGQISTGRN